MLELLHKALESGALAPAALAAFAFIFSGIVKRAPALLRAWTVHSLVRHARKAKTKADRDRACEVLKLLLDAPPPPEPNDPP